MILAGENLKIQEEKNLSQCHFVRKSHMDYIECEYEPPQ
jgi:hypothetical protein